MRKYIVWFVCLVVDQAKTSFRARDYPLITCGWDKVLKVGSKHHHSTPSSPIGSNIYVEECNTIAERHSQVTSDV